MNQMPRSIEDDMKQIAEGLERLNRDQGHVKGADIVADITRQRGSVYGPFLHNAIVSQALKDAMRRIPDPDNEGRRFEDLPLDVREALDLIATKISRIICGDHEYLDNWDDIGGYSKIVADRIRTDHGR